MFDNSIVQNFQNYIKSIKIIFPEKKLFWTFLRLTLFADSNFENTGDDEIADALRNIKNRSHEIQQMSNNKIRLARKKPVTTVHSLLAGVGTGPGQSRIVESRNSASHKSESRSRIVEFQVPVPVPDFRIPSPGAGSRIFLILSPVPDPRPRFPRPGPRDPGDPVPDADLCLLDNDSWLRSFWVILIVIILQILQHICQYLHNNNLDIANKVINKNLFLLITIYKNFEIIHEYTDISNVP